MNKPTIRLALVACAAAAALAGCGGGDDYGSSRGDFEASELPFSALQSVHGLNAYMKQVIADMTTETDEPIVLGGAVLPTSDTLEPL